jgi:lipocalin
MRTGDWKVVSNENRGEAFGVWMEPFVDLRVPFIFNLRRDPYERAQHNANGYYNWMLERVYITYLAADYSQTVISRSQRDYVWIMARTPVITDDDYTRLVGLVAAQGYDTAKLVKVPQRWN